MSSVLVYMQEPMKSLKATCEEFIMAVTKQVVDPTLSFVAKPGYSSGGATLRLCELRARNKSLADQTTRCTGNWSSQVLRSIATISVYL
ncbi:hypothetical protein PVK06_018423 [Gossypium arboreum]|uniref:Uncharacterized protein n=1 Tax=Gossypium arboreum TaxID=29729 RepID=A0ABR0Q5S5_GOSAR|nr:hypothetical protein PVK06_018423 [Gossypium arboreum]